MPDDETTDQPPSAEEETAQAAEEAQAASLEQGDEGPETTDPRFTSAMSPEEAEQAEADARAAEEAAREQ